MNLALSLLDIPTPIIILGIVAVVAVLGILGHLHDKKRRAAIAAWANANGWHNTPGKDRSFRLPFPLFSRGHSCYARFRCTKTLHDPIAGIPDDPRATLFEYHYAVTSGSGKNRSTTHYYYTCIAVTLGFDLGKLDIRREHFTDKFAAVVGFDDIDFEDASFSRRFHVSSPDRQAAYELLHSRMIAWFKGHDEWSLSISRNIVLVFRRTKTKPEYYAALDLYLSRFLSLLPRTLVNRVRAERGLPAIVEAGAAAVRDS